MSDNRARQELRDWTRVRGYWDRAAESLELAANASDPVQDRHVTIAQHYRALAEAEERGADQKGTERPSQRRASIAVGPP
jgi:sRNA-binding protein